MDQMQMHNHTDTMTEHFRFPMPKTTDTGMSEFNHHLAGAVVLFLGVSAILLYAWPRQFRFLKYVWPASLLAFGIYLILYSDPPKWPSGYMSFAASMSDPETRQHKIYALLLIVLGSIELSRAAGLAKANYWKYAFPALATFGALYLVFHEHGSGHEHMMMSRESYQIVLYQHITYIVVGMAAGVSMLLYNMGKLRGKSAPYLWPSFIALLGILLLVYRE